MKNLIITLFFIFSLITPSFGAEIMLDDETTNLYLKRLGLDRDVLSEPKEVLLNKLVKSHLIAIPFENLAMHSSPPQYIDIDHGAVVNKVLKGSAGQNRGGYCYEINELFFRLLKTLNFDVTRHKASVWAGKDPGTIPYPSHQFSLVTIGDEIFLADIGFGLFNIFQAVKLPKDFDQEITIVDNQGKIISFTRMIFDESFGPIQQGREGFVYSRLSERTKKFERISSFAMTTYEPEDFHSHNEYVQSQYRPFLDNVMFTRFDRDGNMIICVKARSEFSQIDDIVRWINDSQGTSSDFFLDVK